MGVGAVVGELELLSGEKRLAEVRALEQCRLLSLSPALFEDLIEKHSNVWQFITDMSKTKTCRLLLSKHLSNLFGTASMKMSNPLARLEAESQWLDFEQEILEQIEENVDWVTLSRGDFLFHQGAQADDAYGLVSGILQVRICGEDNDERVIAEVNPGEIVGEIALITEQGRAASILATRDCELFRLSREVFTRIIEKYPQIMLNVCRTIFERLGRNTSGLVFRCKSPNIAVLTASGDVSIDTLCGDLVAALSEHGSVDWVLSPAGGSCDGSMEICYGLIGSLPPRKNPLVSGRSGRRAVATRPRFREPAHGRSRSAGRVRSASGLSRIGS